MFVRLRIAVADESEARFCDIGSPRAPLQLAGRVENPAARLHDRELKVDRPGRVFDHAPAAGRRRAAVAHTHEPHGIFQMSANPDQRP